MSTALKAVKKFRIYELKGVTSHIMRHGPLPLSDFSVNTLPNPFLPRFNPNTGKWSPPKYSLRRQANLIKQAKASNTLHLLPPGPKLPCPPILPAREPDHININDTHSSKNAESVVASEDSWSLPVNWEGEMKNHSSEIASVGNRLYAGKKRMFKGHKWERVRAERERKRMILLRDMAKRIARYKAHYRRRKPHPLKPARAAKAPKLPF